MSITAPTARPALPQLYGIRSAASTSISNRLNFPPLSLSVSDCNVWWVIYSSLRLLFIMANDGCMYMTVSLFHLLLHNSCVSV